MTGFVEYGTGFVLPVVRIGSTAAACAADATATNTSAKTLLMGG